MPYRFNVQEGGKEVYSDEPNQSYHHTCNLEDDGYTGVIACRLLTLF